MRHVKGWICENIDTREKWKGRDGMGWDGMKRKGWKWRDGKGGIRREGLDEM